MGKTITLERRELIWETRINTWGEKEYNNWVQWLKAVADNSTQDDNEWSRSIRCEYEVFKDYTWDEIVDLINKEDEDEPKVFYMDENNEVSYSTPISEVIRDAIRQDNYETNIYDSDYADDYNEDWSIQSEDR